MKQKLINFKNKVLNLLARLGGYLPYEIPRTPQSLNDFIGTILNTYGLPDNSSMRHAVATMILQLKPSDTHVRPITLADAAKSAIYRDCAYQLIKEIKEETKKILEAQEKAQAV